MIMDVYFVILPIKKPTMLIPIRANIIALKVINDFVFIYSI